ncbi:MAG: radical SAM protein [Desulfurococcaceae archaeon]
MTYSLVARSLISLALNSVIGICLKRYLRIVLDSTSKVDYAGERLFMKVLVIDALARCTGKRYATMDVIGSGPRIVAGIVNEYFETALYPYEYVVKNISMTKNFDLILISAMSTDKLAVERLVSEIRKKGFTGKIILGGPIGFEYQWLLMHIPGIDIVVLGEAEIPLSILLRRMRDHDDTYDDIPALAYKSGDKIVLTSKNINTPREILSSIKPWVKIDHSYQCPWIYRIYVEVVRGCSNFRRPMIRGQGGLNCISCGKCYSQDMTERLKCPAEIPPGCGFCSVPGVFGPPRSRSVKSIVKEIEGLISHGARRIVLSAPDFLDYGRDIVIDPVTDPCDPPANLDALEELLNAVCSLQEVCNKRVVVMIENLKACLVNDEVAKLLGKYLKWTTVHIGLETGCDDFNTYVLGKPITLRHVLDACKLLIQNGLRPYVYLMHSLPFADRDTYVKTKKAIQELANIGVEKITLYKYMSLPATAFEKIPPMDRYKDEIMALKKLVNNYNMITKRDLVGKDIEVFLLKGDKGAIYGYPVYHGPVVFVRGRFTKNPNGCRALVRITNIYSRYVEGVLVRILECP